MYCLIIVNQYGHVIKHLKSVAAYCTRGTLYRTYRNILIQQSCYYFILHKDYYTEVTCFPKIDNRMSSYGPAVSGASVDFSSQVCSSAILVSPNICSKFRSRILGWIPKTLSPCRFSTKSVQLFPSGNMRTDRY
jgi:hypothetical protein